MSTHPPWDDADEVVDVEQPSVLDAFDAYAPEALSDDGSDDPWEGPGASADAYVETLLFTATNPPGTVSVTALLDGRILRVDLEPQVETMTESLLAEEVSIVANLARQQARAAQHVVVLEYMRRLGHDGAATRGFLEHQLGLPSPTTVMHERSRTFATRYASYDE